MAEVEPLVERGSGFFIFPPKPERAEPKRAEPSWAQLTARRAAQVGPERALLEAFPGYVVPFYTKEPVEVRFEPMTHATGHAYWDGERCVIAMAPMGPGRGLRDVVRTCFHELGHVVSGHVLKHRPCWLDDRGHIDNKAIGEVLARPPEPRAQAYTADYREQREAEADAFADREMPRWLEALGAS